MIKDDFMKKVVIGIFTFLLIFTLGMIAIFCITGSTPDTLIVAVFGACIGEYSICGLIKKSKEREKTERMKDGLFENCEDYVEDDEYEYDIGEDIACAPYEPVDEYISAAHEGDIEQEAIKENDGI